VRDALRPFISTNVDAEQVPGDLREEPTRIDTSAPVVTFWVGSSFEGFTAAAVADAPAGAGVVRYAKGAVEWFLASYTPRPKKHCGQVGCASPPPLPHALARNRRPDEATAQGAARRTHLRGPRAAPVATRRERRGRRRGSLSLQR
jgi:hypothetical protein